MSSAAFNNPLTPEHNWRRETSECPSEYTSESVALEVLQAHEEILFDC